jgi:phosphatidylinositol 4-kinase
MSLTQMTEQSTKKQLLLGSRNRVGRWLPGTVPVLSLSSLGMSKKTNRGSQLHKYYMKRRTLLLSLLVRPVATAAVHHIPT